jgi:hypothetical protein
MNIRLFHRIILLIVVSTLSVRHIVAQQERQLVDLRGMWKFEIGDQQKYADPKFDDSKWTEIFVPADWENEGFPGYDGYGWYRKKFVLPAGAKEKQLYVHIIADDVCGIYINGQLIGEGGRFPPEYRTAYNIEHKFYLPSQFLRYGKENTIAVRVYDEMLSGGIVRGKTGIYEHRDEIEYVVKFPDLWKFKKGDNEQWKDPNLDDSNWQELIVPAAWDFQGYRDYDGFGWYRVTVDIPTSAKKESLMLMLGRIDDIDQTYWNGELIGETGRIRSDGSVRKIREEYREFRAYKIPYSLIKYGQKNVIAVRVYDNMVDGGIYEGPIGIVKEQEFKKLEHRMNKSQSGNQNKFEQFLNKIFNE